MKRLLIKQPVTAFLICLSALPLRADELPVPDTTGLPGAEFTREELYIGGALWGLINGGADLYYEYGFDLMALQEITWQDEEFRLELYRMNCPLAAFGIFSVSVHGCEEGGPVSTGDCLNRYQYQLYSDKYYLSLINYSGSTRARELSVEIGNIISSATVDSRIELPGVLRQDIFSEIIDQVKVINGVLGLQNVFPDAVNFYEGMDNYHLWYLKFAGAGGEAEIMLTLPDGDYGNMAGTLEKRLEEAGYATSTWNGYIIAVKSLVGTENSENLLNLILSGY